MSHVVDASMLRASLIRDVRINSISVVRNSYSEFRRKVRQFDRDR
jgi:hypothetical protein